MLNYLQTNTPEMQRLSLAIYHRLANGVPVNMQDLTADLRVSHADVIETLDAFPASQFELDPEDRIVAFCGLSIVTARHQIFIDGRPLFTWCVFDPLFLAPLLETLINLQTVCPQTGRPIELEISPEGVRWSKPRNAVMSMVDPDPAACRDNIRQAFCDKVSLFADATAYQNWSKQKDEKSSFVDMNKAFELALERNKYRYTESKKNPRL